MDGSDQYGTVILCSTEMSEKSLGVHPGCYNCCVMCNAIDIITISVTSKPLNPQQHQVQRWQLNQEYFKCVFNPNDAGVDTAHSFSADYFPWKYGTGSLKSLDFF